MVGIAHRERIGQRRLKRNVVGLVISQTMVTFCRQPLIHVAVIPGLLRVIPGMWGDIPQGGVAGMLR